MGLFRELGRRVERFKSQVETAAEDSGYRCETCDARFDDHHEQCPECAGDVRPIERD